MKIRKQTKKPVTVSFNVEAIEIVTEQGSQSTDYTVLLRDSAGKVIHRQDVRSLEDGLVWCAQHLLKGRQQSEILGVCDIEEISS